MTGLNPYKVASTPEMVALAKEILELPEPTRERFEELLEKADARIIEDINYAAAAIGLDERVLYAAVLFSSQTNRWSSYKAAKECIRAMLVIAGRWDDFMEEEWNDEGYFRRMVAEGKEMIRDRSERGSATDNSAGAGQPGERGDDPGERGSVGWW